MLCLTAVVLPVLKQIQSPDWIGWLPLTLYGFLGLGIGFPCLLESGDVPTNP
jgi:hypothetical protein